MSKRSKWWLGVALLVTPFLGLIAALACYNPEAALWTLGLVAGCVLVAAGVYLMEGHP